MEDLLSQLINTISPTALPLVVVILGLYYIYKKIGNERATTKSERDKDSQEIHDKLLTHDFKITELQGIVNLHRDKLDSIDKQLAIVNQELVKLNVQVEHLVKALETQNEIMKELHK
jgi:peptidoglycan hydrolase CwlO-like protein